MKLTSAGGFVHLDCRKAYFETDDILDPVLHFSTRLSEDDRDELIRACQAQASAERAAQS